MAREGWGDPRRDEDDDPSIWELAGTAELITPELRERIDAVKAARTGTEEEIESILRGSHASSGNYNRATLSARELEIVALAADGLGNTEIADRLCVSAETVKTHISNVSQKLGARPGSHSRTHMVALAYQQRLLPVGDSHASSTD